MHLCFPQLLFFTIQVTQLNFFKIQPDPLWNKDSVTVKNPCLFFLYLQRRSSTIQRQDRIYGLLSAKCVCKAVHWHHFLLLKLMFAFLPCLPKDTYTSLVCNYYLCFLLPRQKLWLWYFDPLDLTGRIASRINEGTTLCCYHSFPP